jgi:hypothetical protein
MLMATMVMATIAVKVVLLAL